MAIDSKIIRIRRGTAADFNVGKTKLVQGEFAVVTNTKEAYFAAENGEAVRLATEKDVSQLQEQIVELEESGIGGSGGQPIVVKTATVMTDTTAIYLYMGEGETVNGVTYEYGYIYTYDTDTSTWVNSGLYGKGQDGQNGSDGEDGFSPTVTATETDTGVSIIVTNKDGSKSVEVKNGTDGKDGADGKDGTATDEQVKTFVDEWLDEHPDATSTVGKGSVTPEKTDFLEVKKPVAPLELTYEYVAYLTDATVEYIDISDTEKLIIIADWTGYTPNIKIAFYDADKNLLSDYATIEDVVMVDTYYDETNSARKYIVKLSVDCSILDSNIVYVKISKYPNNQELNTLAVYKGDYSIEKNTLMWSESYVSPVVLGGSVTLEKTDFITYENPSIIDLWRNENSGYSGEMSDKFGQNKTVVKGYIDVSVNKSIYARGYTDRSIRSPLLNVVACYDENKNFLSRNDDTHRTETLVQSVGIGETNPFTGQNGYICVYRYDFTDEVKYVRIAIGGYWDIDRFDYFMVTYEEILDLYSHPSTYKKIVSEKWKSAVQSCIKSNDIKTMVMIGDSLTNWAGGNSSSNGFLKVVYDKTGVVPKNEGLAGAWWQMGDGQETGCGVARVNTLISEGRKYDLYCFMLGTNAGSATDTGETSADTTTMSGAIRYCLETLKAYDPTAQILVCLPPQRAEGNENQEKVNEVIKAIAESYSVKTLDIYHHSGIVPNTKIEGVNYLSDGLHLGENGYTMLGNLLASEIKYLFCI